MASKQGLIVALGVGTTLWLLSLIIYRRFFHPLAKFPGPFFDSISQIPAILRVMSPKDHYAICKLHDKYGPVVRTSPTELSFNSAGAWEEIYGFRPRAEEGPMEKDPLSTGALKPVKGLHVLTRSPRWEHARQRKILAHPFTNTALLQQEEIIRFHVDNFVSKLSELADRDKGVVNLSDWFDFLFADIISALSFGEAFGCVDSQSGLHWRRNLQVSFKAGLYEAAIRRAVGPGLLWLEQALTPGWIKKSRKEMFEESAQKMLARLKQGTDGYSGKRDFIYYILRGNEGGKTGGGMSEMEMIFTAVLFIGAGSDTTSTAVTGFFHLILTHPDCLARLVAEIRGAFPTYESINHSKLHSLPYLNACISESLRLLYPITIGLMRSVPPSGATISGYFVPRGTTVSVHPWSASRSEANWKRASEFLPERWLGGDEWVGDQRTATQPFSIGPRGCIGKNLAMIEFRLVVATLLWFFNFDDISREKRGAWEKDGGLDSYMVWERNEFLVKLTKNNLNGL
ncbi:cytochrome P450 [Cladorrhinum sp. PSN332]|nr:cytochrome P450 [Cladorrhinum sp. PSN332]